MRERGINPLAVALEGGACTHSALVHNYVTFPPIHFERATANEETPTLVRPINFLQPSNFLSRSLTHSVTPVQPKRENTDWLRDWYGFYYLLIWDQMLTFDLPFMDVHRLLVPVSFYQRTRYLFVLMIWKRRVSCRRAPAVSHWNNSSHLYICLTESTQNEHYEGQSCCIGLH